MLLIGGLAAVAAAIVLVVLTTAPALAQQRQVKRSLTAVRNLEALPPHMRKELDPPARDRLLVPALDKLSRVGRRLTPVGQAERLRRKLDFAGNPRGWDVERALAFKVVGLAAGAIGGILLGRLFGFTGPTLIGVLLLTTVVGFYAPDLALYQVAYNRTEQLRKELADAMDLLTISVEAGLSFDSALAQVARNTEGPLAEEFFRVLQEMQIGLGRTEALRALGDRTALPDLKGFVSAMVQADAFGIPIANVLRVQARELRIKRTQRAEELAQKVPVKILFPLIFCILPALFAIVIGPAGIGIFRNLRV